MGWWTWATKRISGCIMVSMSLPVAIAISMALSHSGHMRNGKLAKFNGVPRQTFLLHLKECEFRFNYRAEDLSDRILTLLKENPLLKLSRPFAIMVGLYLKILDRTY